MRATLSYTVLRLGLFVVVFLLLYLAGARSLLLLAGSILISGVISYFALTRAAVSDVGRDQQAARRLPGPSRRGHQGRRSGLSRLPPSPISQPPLVSIAMILPVACSRLITDVSSTSTASAGSSYGSDTPVNCLISPALALAYRPLRSRCSHTSTGVATWIEQEVAHLARPSA